MTTQSRRIRAAFQLAALVAVTSARAATLTTPPVHPDPNGRLSCTAVNVSGRAIGIAAQIVNTAGDNVTDFISTAWANETDTVLAAVTAESSADAARYCRVTVSGGGRAQVRASLEALDANGNRTAIVEAH
jgi:hypothetical protein